MESYWCLKKNSLIDMMKNPEKYNPALTPCLKTECDMWRERECIHFRKVGK
jgi:hypothetical protein